jgi:uncharacterized protein (DUF2267 family)
LLAVLPAIRRRICSEIARQFAADLAANCGQFRPEFRVTIWLELLTIFASNSGRKTGHVRECFPNDNTEQAGRISAPSKLGGQAPVNFF